MCEQSSLVTDISRYVALPAQLEEWRGAMRAAEAKLDAGRRDEAAAVLGPLAATTGAARARAEDIVQYWVLRVAYDRRIAQWDRFIATNRVDPPQAAQITAARQRLDAAMATQDFRLAGHTLLPEINGLIGAGFVAGRKLALDVQRDDRPARTRSTPCPPAPVPLSISPSGKPRIDPTRFQSAETFYPPGARRERRDGRVNVEAQIDASGCALSAMVVVSSGDADIDAAALDLALRGGAYLPGSDESGATSGTIRFWIQFDMRDPE